MDTIPAFITAQAALFALAVARIGGFMLTTPFPGKQIPTQIKVGLVILLAFLACSSRVGPVPGAPGLDLALIGLVPGELGIGIVIGFTIRITFSAAEMIGVNFAQATGLTMGQVYDPSLGTEDPIPARVVTLFAMLLFLSLGAHRVAIAYTLESFRALPIGQAVDVASAAPIFVDYVGQAIDAGVRLSVPIMSIAIGVHVALALIARASPSLQIFSVGMGISVAAGLLAILGSLGDSSSGLAAELEREAPRIEHVLEGMSPARP